MHVHTWVFDRNQDIRYSRMTRVFQRSLENQCIPCTVHTMPAPPPTGRPHWMDSNHEKLLLWSQTVQELADGDLALISDSDMLCVSRPSQDLLDSVRFVGLTQRDKFYPINGGMIVVRGSEEARRFFRAWVDSDTHLYTHATEHQRWRKKYAGMNQASLGRILETREDLASLIDYVPCDRTNMCKPWVPGWEDAHFIHVKSELRKAVFDPRVLRLHPGLAPIVDMWKTLERETGYTPPPQKDLPEFQRGRYHAGTRFTRMGGHVQRRYTKGCTK